MPIVARYLARLRGRPRRPGRRGAAPDHAVERRPDERGRRRRAGRCTSSNPARPAAWSARRRWPTPAASPDVITFDMGGTTAKAGIIERGEFARALEYQVGGGIMAGSRLLTGAGYLLKVPAIDLAEVGAGGGSILGSMPAARCWSARTAPARCPARSATTPAAMSRRSPTPISSSATSTQAIWSAALETQRRAGARRDRRDGSRGRSACRSSTPPMALTRSPPPT